MTLHIKVTHLVIGLVVGAVLAGAGYAIAATRAHTLTACVNRHTRVMRMPLNGRCMRSERKVRWNSKGPRGERGRTGARGASGAAGVSATVQIGAVTTGTPGSSAAVTNVGTPTNAKLDFTIPVNASTGPTAWGEVDINAAPTASTNSATLAYGSSNVVSAGPIVASTTTGKTQVVVSGCSAAGINDPVITVTADQDPADTAAGASAVYAYVDTWSVAGGDLTFYVETLAEGTTGEPGSTTFNNSDYGFSVIC